MDFFKKIKFPGSNQNGSGNIIYVVIIAALILVIILMFFTYSPNLIEMPGKLARTLMESPLIHQFSSILEGEGAPAEEPAPAAADDNENENGDGNANANGHDKKAEESVPAEEPAPVEEISAEPITPLAETPTPTDEITPLVETPTPTDEANPAPAPTLEPQPEPAPQPVAPSIASVEKVVSPILYGTFKTGAVPVMVLFDKPITVSGRPKLIMSTGSPAETEATYRFSSRNYILFIYQISPGNYSSDLDYASASSLILNGGQINDAFGNSANLALPQPGSSYSLSTYSDIIIDTTSE